MGRPRVDSEAINVRFERVDIAELDEWIDRQPELMSRPEAVRRLTKQGLRFTVPPRLKLDSTPES